MKPGGDRSAGKPRLARAAPLAYGHRPLPADLGVVAASTGFEMASRDRRETAPAESSSDQRLRTPGDRTLRGTPPAERMPLHRRSCPPGPRPDGRGRAIGWGRSGEPALGEEASVAGWCSTAPPTGRRGRSRPLGIGERPPRARRPGRAVLPGPAAVVSAARAGGEADAPPRCGPGAAGGGGAARRSGCGRKRVSACGGCPGAPRRPARRRAAGRPVRPGGRCPRRPGPRRRGRRARRCAAPAPPGASGRRR